jgi:hypothetical protein
MSDAKKNGNRPIEITYDEDGLRERGLTKRELFAAMAMQGLCAYPSLIDDTVTGVARLAVEQADALLAELAKEPT